jgi:cellulose biosynthesis protein BcsQ
MKSIAVFNNKGGVGKTTLTYHLGYALAELGHKTLLVDLDPQSNLTLFGLHPEELHDIWQVEDAFIDDFVQARDKKSPSEFDAIASDVRSIHFLLKPTEDGTDGPKCYPRPLKLHDKLGMIPGRLSVHTYEDTIGSRWNAVYRGDPLAIRTVTQIRSFCEVYGKKYNYELVVIDTSPSLGILNKVIISTVDGFLIPCMPDMFSLYGIQNIGKSLKRWKSDFDTIFNLLSDAKLSYFPKDFVSFLGFTIFNARKRAGSSKWDLPKAHQNYAEQIPTTIRAHIDADHRKHLTEWQLEEPVGETAVMHSYSTLPTMAQKYRTPIWKVPSCENLDKDDKRTISGNREQYESTQTGFHIFAKDLLTRLDQLEGNNG